jgi:SAM-dependent methyltransferase
MLPHRKSKKLIKLNLGSGSSKIEGFVNIDVEPSCKPDLVCNFITDRLPYVDDTVDEVVLFHCIEHIGKRFHRKMLCEIWRVLKPGCMLTISYPEYLKCVQNWKTNFKGQKEFWEATLYGRQLYVSDFHVCIMHTSDFIEVLGDCGFIKPINFSEPIETYNTIVNCFKGNKPPNYEDLIRDQMTPTRSKK